MPRVSVLMASDAILVIDHRLRGCSNNVQAIALAISRLFPGCETDVIRCKLRSKILFPILSALIAIKPFSIPKKMKGCLWRLLFTGPPPPRDNYRFVVSTMGKGEAPALFVTHLWDRECVSIHYGAPRYVSRKRFHAVINDFSGPMQPEEICLSTPPSRIVFEKHAEKETTEQTWNPEKIYTLLIGGPTKDMPYSNTFWNDVLSFMEYQSRRHKVSWLVTTSPRTPDYCVSVLQDAYTRPESVIKELSIYNAAEPSRLSTYLQAAQTIFVTGESISMIADGCAARKRVVALANKTILNCSRISGFYDRMRETCSIHILDLDNAPQQDFDQSLCIPDKSWVDDLYKGLNPYIETPAQLSTLRQG